MKPQLRCSSLDRIITCPGSRTLESRIAEESIDIGDVSGNEMTWRGSWCHWEAARRLIADHGAIAPEGGLLPPEVPADWRPTQWEYRTVNWYLGMLLELTPKDHVFYVEQAFRWESDGFILTGHIDVFSISPDGEEVHWNDLKTGLGEVDEAESNWQVGGYGALLKNAFASVKRGTARIFQQSATRPVSEVEIDDMDRLLPHIAKRINEALGSIYRQETGKHCTYCPALITCATTEGCAFNQELKRMKALLTAEQVAKLKAVPNLKDLAEVAHQCRAIEAPAKKIIESLRERMPLNTDVVLSTGVVARLVEENGPRKVTHPKAVFDFLGDRLDADKLWPCFEPSLGAIEDALCETGMKRNSKDDVCATGIIKSMSHLYEQPKLKKLKFVAV